MESRGPVQSSSEQIAPQNVEGAVAQNLGTPSTEGSRVMTPITVDSSENPPGLPPEKAPAAQTPNPVEGVGQTPTIPPAEGGVKPL